MTCEQVIELAIDFLDGTLAGEARDGVARHLQTCDDCRGLVASLRHLPPEDPALTSAILSRTSGPVCEVARERLSAWDGPALDLGPHLAGCDDCAALGRVLSAMREELPRLADVAPDPEFVGAVLAKTSLRRRPTPPAERWAFTIRRLLDRPRIALEGAFVASVMLVLPLGSSASVDALSVIRQASAAASANLDIMAHTAWGATKGFVAQHVGTFSSSGASGQGNDETAQEKRR